MASIMILSKTERGELAISKHLSDSTKVSWRDKQFFRMWYDQSTWKNDEGRLCLTLTIKSKALHGLLEPSMLAKPVDQAMKANGATKGLDYELSVKA